LRQGELQVRSRCYGQSPLWRRLGKRGRKGEDQEK
jgi:ribosomal protein L15